MQVSNYKIETDKKPIVICHITDMHYSKKYPRYLFYQYIEEIKKREVDYICITGDLLDDALVYHKVNMKPFYDFFKKLSPLAPIICIIGNHDQTTHKARKTKYQDPTYLEFTLKRLPNVHLLHNDIYEDEKATFLGYVGDPFLLKDELKKEKPIIDEIKKLPFKEMSIKKHTILLSHSPLTLGKESVQKQIPFLEKIDVILSGHTHDGLYPFPKKGNRGIISPNKKLFPKNVRGMLPTSVPVVISGGMVKLSYVSGIFRYFDHFFSRSITWVEMGKKR